MKKLIALLLVLSMALSLCACGGSKNGTTTESPAVEETTAPAETEPAFVTQTDCFTLNGICVDDSYVGDNSALKMVYVFFTVTAVDTNLKTDSTYMNLTINDTNTYQSENYADAAAACKYMPNVYYSSYIEDVYMGTSLLVVATFKIPEADLAAGRIITLSDHQIPGIEAVRFSTDEIRYFATPEELAAAMDPEGYAADQAAREEADDATTQMVRNQVNGYYWSFFVNNTSYEIEFWGPNNFEVRTAFGTNSGTYSVRNGYIFCTYPSNGYTVEIPYAMVNGEIDLDVVSAFDVSD